MLHTYFTYGKVFPNCVVSIFSHQSPVCSDPWLAFITVVVINCNLVYCSSSLGKRQGPALIKKKKKKENYFLQWKNKMGGSF